METWISSCMQSNDTINETPETEIQMQEMRIECRRVFNLDVTT